MLHLMKYRLISIMKEKEVVFWSMLFPILLGTLFYVSFGNSNTEIETIDVAVVKNDDSIMAQNFIEYLEMIEEDDANLISVKEMSEKEAVDKLKNLKVTGVYYVAEETELVVSSNNIGSSILKSLLDTYNRQAKMYKTIAADRPESLADIVQDIDYMGFVRETTLTGKKVDGMIQYFLSLIGMACMFGCFIGYTISVQLQANVTPVALRRAVTPMGKFKQLIADTLVGLILQYINLAVLILYLNFVLKIDLNENIPKLLVICLTGGFIGVSLGILVGTLSKLKEGARIGILVTVGLVMSFMAGLMISGIKRVIELSCPVINRINPAAVITDAIYSASIYDDSARYMKDILVLLIMSVIIGLVTFIITRRKCYDSI